MTNKPFYQQCYGKKINYGISAKRALGQESILNQGELNYKSISSLLQSLIKYDLISTESLNKLLNDFENINASENSSALELMINPLKLKLVNYIEDQLTSNAAPILTCFKKHKMSINNEFVIGDITIKIPNNEHFKKEIIENYKPIFSFDDLIVVWQLPLDLFPNDVSNLIKEVSTIAADMCHAVPPIYSMNKDEDLAETLKDVMIENLSKLLDELNYNDIHSSEEFDDILLKYVDQNTYREIRTYFVDYIGCDVDEIYGFAVERLNETIPLMLLEHDPLVKPINVSFDFNLSTLIKRINASIKKYPTYKNVLSNVNKAAKVVKKLYVNIKHEFNFHSDCSWLGQQQFISFKSLKNCSLSLACIDNAGNYLLETGENAEIIIDTSDKHEMDAFRNMQLGWLLLDYLYKTLLDFHKDTKGEIYV